MKTRPILILAAIAACAGASAKDVPVRVFVDERETKLKPPAIMRDGKAYVGLRGVATALGASTKWNEKSKTATVTVGNKRTKVKQSDAIMIKNQLYVPLRVVGEAVGCTVGWDAAARAVKITKEAPCPPGGG